MDTLCADPFESAAIETFEDWSVTLDRREVEFAVDMAGKLAMRQSTIPALGAVRLGLTPEGQPCFYATNLDAGIEVRLDDPVPGFPDKDRSLTARSLLVGVKEMRDALRAMRATGAASVGFTVEEGSLTLTAGALDIRLNAPMKPDDLPVLGDPNFDSPTFRQISLATAADFAQALTFVAKAVSTEETRYYLNGVCIDRDEKTGDILLVATDGHRLHAAPVRGIEEPAPTDPDCRPIVPLFTVNTLRRLLAKEVDPHAPFALDLDDKRIRFAADLPGMRVIVVSKLIDGTYPDWRKVVPPTKRRKRMVCDAARLIAAASVLACGLRPNTACDAAVLERQAGRKTIALEHKRLAGESILRTTAPCAGGGIRDVKIGLNPCYLRDALAAFDNPAETIGISFDAKSPASCPAVLAAAKPGPFVILMPMRI